MKKQTVTAILIVLGLSVLMCGCAPGAARRQATALPEPSPAIASSPSQAHTSPTPSPAASPQPSENPLREPTFDELEKATTPELLELDRCAPVDEVVFTPQSGPAPLTVKFDGRAATAPCGKLVKWVWDFGDGTSASGARVKHTYSHAGEYVVTLNVTDNQERFNLTPLEYRINVTAPTTQHKSSDK